MFTVTWLCNHGRRVDIASDICGSAVDPCVLHTLKSTKLEYSATVDPSVVVRIREHGPKHLPLKVPFDIRAQSCKIVRFPDGSYVVDHSFVARGSEMYNGEFCLIAAIHSGYGPNAPVVSPWALAEYLCANGWSFIPNRRLGMDDIAHIVSILKILVIVHAPKSIIRIGKEDEQSVHVYLDPSGHYLNGGEL